MGEHRGDILDKAKALTCGDRNLQYGEPGPQMALSARWFELYMNAGGDRYALAHTAAIHAVFMKLARIACGKIGHMDNYYDGAAYIAIAGENVGARMELLADQRKVLMDEASELERLRTFVRDLMEGGLRTDLNPTRRLSKDEAPSPETEQFYTSYLTRADAQLRTRAAAVLQGPKPPTLVGKPLVRATSQSEQPLIQQAYVGALALACEKCGRESGEPCTNAEEQGSYTDAVCQARIEAWGKIQRAKHRLERRSPSQQVGVESYTGEVPNIEAVVVSITGDILAYCPTRNAAEGLAEAWNDTFAVETDD